MNDTGLRRIQPDQSSGSQHTFGTSRHPSITNPILSKRVCFYKSGDPQFSGLRMVINNRTFKTFDALLDTLSKKVPLPFGVRNITTPRGVHAIYTLDELEDGKSYICSDNRKVKPINLALARKKMPPWYHARPVSSRRRTVQQARIFPGSTKHRPRPEPVGVRTPKKLLVFRNGDPTVRYTVVLQKRTLPTFDFILEYISEVLQFPVMKLYTADGRRVDGLPGLILCSGTVVAVGRETFKPANYNAQRSPAQTRQPNNRRGSRRPQASNRKKKSHNGASGSRKFSPSSERYIVNRIQNAMEESSCELPSNHTDSFELESSRPLESVAEVEGDACQGQESTLPSEDDIEKSFRVNQDGSMTVEMRVRLTIKEEETLHWTTTLSRSSVANQCDMMCLPESQSALDNCLPTPNPLDTEHPSSSSDAVNKDKSRDDYDDDPPSLGNGASSQSSNEVENHKTQRDLVSSGRTSTPGHGQIIQKQASVESVKAVRAGIQEDMVGSYSYAEQSENGATVEQFCMVKQSSRRPVPKPRRFGSVDAHSIRSRNVSSFKSTGMTEILQIESSGDEVTETVLHIYEQQTCQDNYLANVHGVSTAGELFYRPATSETRRLSTGQEPVSELWRPSTASESISIWRAESKSVVSDFTLPSLRTDTGYATNKQRRTQVSTQSKDKNEKRGVGGDGGKSSKSKAIRRLMSPRKKRKENSPKVREKRKKVQTFSSAGFIKRIYGKQSTSPKAGVKLRKRSAHQEARSVTAKTSAFPGDKRKHSLNMLVNIEASEGISSQTKQLEASTNKTSQPGGSSDLSKILPLPAFNSRSSIANEYVANWLEKAQIVPAAGTDLESEVSQAAAPAKQGSEISKSNAGGITSAEDVKGWHNKSETYPTFKTDPLTHNVQQMSVKQRIRSFENKSSSSPEAPKVTQPIGHHCASSTNTENYCANAVESHLNDISERNPQTERNTAEIPSRKEAESKSRPTQISIPVSNSDDTSYAEFPSPPPPVEIPTDMPTDMPTGVSSDISSPSYKQSIAVSGQISDTCQSSVNPTCDGAVAYPDSSMEMSLPQNAAPPVLKEEPLSRSSSVKRAPLVSNQSLERKMSLRKACLDSYALCGDDTSSVSINTLADVARQSDACAAEIKPPCSSGPRNTESDFEPMSSPSLCASFSPTSFTSEERASSTSIPSTEPPTSPIHIRSEETRVLKSPSAVKKAESVEKKVNSHRRLSPKRSVRFKGQSHDTQSTSPQPASRHSQPHVMPKIGAGQNTTTASPLPEKRQGWDQRPSLHSQSLDMVSAPVRQTADSERFFRNTYSDTMFESTDRTQSKTSGQGKFRKTKKPTKSTAGPERSPMCGRPDEDADRTNDSDVDEAEEKHVADAQMTTHPSGQSDTTTALENVCCLIKSIREVTQSQTPPCLEKPGSSPQFSSRVASTFGSSSKALLAFLSVMTLKEVLTNLNRDELNTNSVSRDEALKMMESLREIASVDDSVMLQRCLSHLQRSASKELLESLKGFQELSDKCRSSTPKVSVRGLALGASSEHNCVTEENVIDEILDILDLPQTLREELASLSEVRSSGNEEVSSGVYEQLDLNENSDGRLPDLTGFTAENVSQEESEAPADHVTAGEEDHVATRPPVRDEVGEETASAEGTLGRRCNSDSEDWSSGKDAEAVEGHRQKAQCEEDAPGNGLACDENPGSGGAQQEGTEQEKSCEENASGDETEEEAELQVEQEETEQESENGARCHFEPPGANYYVELSADRDESIARPQEEQRCTSDEELPESERKGPNNGDTLPDASTYNSDADESISSEEEPEIERDTPADIVEERASSLEEKQQEEVCLNNHQNQLESRREEREITVISEGVDLHVRVEQKGLRDSQDSYYVKDVGCSSEYSDHLEENYTFDVEEDSGNDHRNCEELERSKVEDEEIRSSAEEELSVYEKESSSEEEQVNPSGEKEGSCSEAIPQSVSTRVSLLERQVANAQERKTVPEDYKTGRCSLRIDPLPAEESSEKPKPPGDTRTSSAPQSSLSFSYDSSGVIATEPEGSKVKSIREMFLARSSADVPRGQKNSVSPNKTELFKKETTAHDSCQTSSEPSSGEEDSSRKSITKGFVRRTIERLYGKSDANPEGDASEKTPSAPKQKKKVNSSIFSPFHIARSKAGSELSYFNSTNALDTLTEATQCMAFNAQVGPGDSVDAERWLLRDSAVIRKSVSDPIGINKTFARSLSDEATGEDTQENPPYSLFSTKSEAEDKKKCTYFSLPHMSDSEACPDDTSTASKHGEGVVDAKDGSVRSDPGPEWNGVLPGAILTDFKMMDNKVHPLVELPDDHGVVVAQPRKGQGAVCRRPQEPDVLDLLYNFCGEHCPIL